MGYLYDILFQKNGVIHMLTPSLPYMTEISIIIRQVTLPYMTEISIGFTIVTPGMHFGPEVNWLSMFIV